jgi:HSP20 family protein
MFNQTERRITAMKVTTMSKPQDARTHQQSRPQQQKWADDGYDWPALFDDFFTRDMRPAFWNTGVSTPAVNIIETNEDFRLEMVAPGMKKEDFKVTLQNNVLTIVYDHEDNRQGERRDWKYRTHEYNYHSFSRSFSLPETVEAEKINAKYENGILNLLIPKIESARTKPARQIPVS